MRQPRTGPARVYNRAMTASACLPEPHAMQAALRDALPGFGDIAWLPVTGSTNADLLARARSADAPALPWLLGAHLQQAGRGRAGRSWQNAPGDALMMSCAFALRVPASRLSGLSPAAGIAACEALRQLAGAAAAPRLAMKWPNDVQFDGAKLAGVLVETVRSAQGGDAFVAVIGMGVNLRGAADLSRRLGRAVADWSQVTATLPAGEHPPLAAVAAACAAAWHTAVQAYEREGFSAFAGRFDRVDALAGRTVDVIDDGRIVLSGPACGVDPHGRLLVADGTQHRPISVGEISIRAQA